MEWAGGWVSCFFMNKCSILTLAKKQQQWSRWKWGKMGLKTYPKNKPWCVCESTICAISRHASPAHTCMILYLISTANTSTQPTIWGGGGVWMTCYLVISRKLRRVERSSRRLICLWHWLQKKSSASSLRKLWKQSGRGAGALERGDRGGKRRRKWWVTDKKGCTEVGQDTSEGGAGAGY